MVGSCGLAAQIGHSTGAWHALRGTQRVWVSRWAAGPHGWLPPAWPRGQGTAMAPWYTPRSDQPNLLVPPFNAPRYQRVLLPTMMHQGRLHAHHVWNAWNSRALLACASGLLCKGKGAGVRAAAART